jgi:LAGLIDADG endonuclease
MVLQNNNYNIFFLQWLIGFIDAEGNFQITIQNKNKNKQTKKNNMSFGLQILI